MMIDLHCHILPDMDDGPSLIEESVLMAQTALKDGIVTIAATPHFSNSREIDLFLTIRETKVDSLFSSLSAQGIEADIVKGAEVYMDMGLFEIGGIEKLTLNGTRYILTELPMLGFPLYTEEFLYRLQLLGLVPIIAHPERNDAIIKNPELLGRLVDLGSLAQVNTGSITGLFGRAVQKCAQKILSSQMAHIVATDAHSNGRRKPNMSDCLKVLQKWVGPEEADKLTALTPAAILANRVIDEK